MTYTLKLTPTGLALLDGYCRAAGRNLKDALGLHLTETAASQTAATAATAAAASPEALPSPAPLIQPPPPFAPPVPATPAEEDALLATLGN